MRDGSCARCGEVVAWGPPRCPSAVWVHRDPQACVDYLIELHREKDRLREEERKREDALRTVEHGGI